MADAFLRELFQAQNRARKDEGQECIICMEDWGTINPKTGLAEIPIRLPCKHIVGKGCITQWLHSNNTCPLCRRVFFPAQARPYLEHGIMESQADRAHSSRRTTRNQDMNGPAGRITTHRINMSLLCNRYCRELYLELDVAHVAASVIANLLQSWPSSDALQTHDNHHIVAVSIYIASNLTGHYRSPREIAGVTDDVSRESIRATYDLIRDWRTILDDDIRTQLVTVFEIRRLVWPPSRAELKAREAGLEWLIELCTEYGMNLGVFDNITLLARKIATRVWTLPCLHQTRCCKRVLAATCLYMASPLMGLRRSKASIYQVIDESVADISICYISLYRERRHILQESWLPLIGKENMEEALAMLPDF